jgi:hypothetical protein
MSVSKTIFFLFVTDVGDKQVFRAESHINRVLPLTCQTKALYLLVLPLDVWGRIHNTFFFVNHEWSQQGRMYVPIKPFHPSFMFMGKAWSLP